MFSALGIVMCSRLTFNVAISHPFTYILEEANGKNLDYVSITYTQNPKKTYKKRKERESCIFIITFYGSQWGRVHEAIKIPFIPLRESFVNFENVNLQQ